MASKILIDWFDALEGTLEAETKVAGLLDHASTIGQAREFLVGRVLKTILPASVHVGAGKVIDYQGNMSKQIDIIIYDPRFPMLKIEGGGLYFVEGTLATIEIKSSIDTNQLNGSLDNCKSVLDLQPYGEHPHEAAQQIKFYRDKGGLSEAEATDRFHFRFRPATYIFAFKSALSFETACNGIAAWWHVLGCPHSAYFPLLPRVITAGNCVAVIDDGRITLRDGDGKPHMMVLFETERRFRWLAVHIMDAVSQRLGLRNFAERFDYRLTDYYPFDEYVAEIKKLPTRFLDRDICTPPPAI